MIFFINFARVKHYEKKYDFSHFNFLHHLRICRTDC